MDKEQKKAIHDIADLTITIFNDFYIKTSGNTAKALQLTQCLLEAMLKGGRQEIQGINVLWERGNNGKEQ